MKRVYIFCSAIGNYRMDVIHFVFSADEGIKEIISESEEGMSFFGPLPARPINLYELYNGKIEAYDDAIKNIYPESGRFVICMYDEWANRIMYRSVLYTDIIIQEVINSDDIDSDVAKLYLKERLYRK